MEDPNAEQTPLGTLQKGSIDILGAKVTGHPRIYSLDQQGRDSIDFKNIMKIITKVQFDFLIVTF